MAFAREVIRQGITGLTVPQCVAAMDADILIGGRAVERIVYGGGSRGRFGQHHCLNPGIEEGTLVAEEYSSLTIIIIRHEARKLNEALSFVTSPGYLRGDGGREAAGLRGGPGRVITDKAIFGFDPESKRMRLMSIHPGTTREEVLENMNFVPVMPDDLPVTEPPTAEQIRLIREEIDPDGMYAG